MEISHHESTRISNYISPISTHSLSLSSIIQHLSYSSSPYHLFSITNLHDNPISFEPDLSPSTSIHHPSPSN
jgi:hypothetical protein